MAHHYERGSILIATNQSVSQWGTVFGDDVLAAAILDRLLHHSHTLMIRSDGYRLKQKNTHRTSRTSREAAGEA